MSDMERKGFIGGSDIADVFNIEPYGCARRLYYEKTGVEPDYPKDNFHMRRGTILEPVAAMLYAQETGHKIRKRNLRLIDDEYPFMAALLDREIIKDERGPGVLEVKCPSMRTYLDVKRKGIQEAYILQIQHYLRVRKAEWGAFCAFSAELAEVFHFEVMRDEELIQKVVEGELAFWELVQRHTIPDQLDKKDKRCMRCTHGTTCQGITNDEYLAFAANDTGVELIMDEELERYADEYWEIKTVCDEASEMMDGVKEKIKARMEAIQTPKIQVGGSKVYFTEVISNRLDGRRLKLERPDIAKEYTKPSSSKRLILYKAR